MSQTVSLFFYPRKADAGTQKKYQFFYTHTHEYTIKQKNYGPPVQYMKEPKHQNNRIDNHNLHCDTEAETICPCFILQMPSKHNRGPDIHQKQVSTEYFSVFYDPIHRIHISPPFSSFYDSGFFMFLILFCLEPIYQSRRSWSKFLF